MAAEKPLAQITEPPKPPQEDVARAKKEGAKIVAYHPDQLRAFAEGRITLGELEGISKESQYQMAKIGYEFLNEGKLDSAFSVFQGLSALDPYDAYFHASVGAVHHQKNALEDAERAYSRALEINPCFATAFAHRGEIRLAFGNLEPAIADLLSALKFDPDLKEQGTQRARALLNTIRGQAEAVQADPAKALSAAKNALETEGKKVSAKDKLIPEPSPASKPKAAKSPVKTPGKTVGPKSTKSVASAKPLKSASKPAPAGKAASAGKPTAPKKPAPKKPK